MKALHKITMQSLKDKKIYIFINIILDKRQSMNKINLYLCFE